MWWRLKRSEFEIRKGSANRRAMRRIVKSGEVPGILAYHNREAIAWCALSPRDCYPVLSRSRILKPIDERPVWSVGCFFVHRSYRKQGVTVKLLRAAIDHVRSRGGRILEGYPVDPRDKEMPAAFAWTGLVSAFRRAGFRECARRSPGRPIMRRTITGGKKS